MKNLLLLVLCVIAFSFTALNDKRTLSFDEFDSIAISNSANVFLSHGSEQSVVVKADSKILDRLDLEVKKGTLHIKNKKNIKRNNSWSSKNGLEVYITLPTFEALSISGSGDFVMEDAFNLPSLKIAIAGSGDVVLREGSAEDFRVSIAGSGDVDCDMTTMNAIIKIAGSGDVDLIVEEHLEVSIAGSGDVTYQGNPQHVDVKTVGSGEVHKR